jgi:hypothetical protein
MVIPDDELFATLMKVIHETKLNPEDRSYVLATAWTLDQVPKIKTRKQYKWFKQQADDLAKKYWDGSPEDMERFYRSPKGQLVAALDARCLEWEERREPSLDLD